MGTIVVGVDGSDKSKHALRWAAEEAALRGADLEVVYAYDYEPLSDVSIWEVTSEEHVRRMQQDLQRETDQVRRSAEAFVEDVAREISQQGVKVETLVLRDRHPAHALVEQSEGADMLVVGSRGRGGFTGLILGSVSQHCVHHAKCPVTVVRGGG